MSGQSGGTGRKSSLRLDVGQREEGRIHLLGLVEEAQEPPQLPQSQPQEHFPAFLFLRIERMTKRTMRTRRRPTAKVPKFIKISFQGLTERVGPVGNTADGMLLLVKGMLA